ncbi:hypothetical protein BDW59DRAFT_178184 [Aspergillus cavernicola]|uniref:DUF6536 domain-containing protein n=1 Tax=Aspergillus cavernicola TaxID=176166 RepID=A0ABR4IQD2_9EURO
MFYRRHQHDAKESEKKPKLLSHLRSWRSSSGKTEMQDISDSDHARAWITGVVVCSWVIGGVLALNIILTIIAAALAYSNNSQQSFTFASLHTGKCSVAKNWTTGLHLVINILSTVMLGASNYCMQCLASPSRAQVDEAHNQRTWIRIGVPNIWNLLRRQRGKRQWLGYILLITSLPIHLIYNSAIFFSLGPTEYTVVTAQASPVRGNISTDFEQCFAENVGIDRPSFNAAMSGGELETLSRQECIDTFAQDYVSGQRTLILVTNASMSENEPMGWVGKGNSKSFDDKSGSTFKWLCDDNIDCTKGMAEEMMENWSVRAMRWSTPSILLSVPTTDGFYDAQGYLVIGHYGIPDTADHRHLNDLLEQHPSEDRLQAQLDDPSGWANSSFPGNVTILGHEARCVYSDLSTEKLPQAYAVDHCITSPAEETCQLFFSPPICLIVIGCNLIKLLCTLFTARDSRDDVFLTVGDAIASLLTRPDPTTVGACLLSKSLVDKGTHGWRKPRGKSRESLDIQVDQQKLPLRLPPRNRWFQAVSMLQWLLTLTTFACMLIPAIYLLRLGIIDYNQGYGVKTIWDSGLGEVTTATILNGLDVPATASGIFSMVFMANTPQLLVSAAYFLYNALLTGMLGAVEYDNYAQEQKPLRVSWPRGAQRSTYYLSLPYRYSIPLLIVSAVLHWLVSQSFFFVEIIPFDLYGVAQHSEEVVTCGYSPVAIIFAIIVGGSLPIVSILLGLRRFKSHMPLALQCSAAISAACHPTISTSTPDGDNDHALKPVQWGELPGGYSSPSPLAFSNRISGDAEVEFEASGNAQLNSGSDEQRQILSTTCLDINDTTRSDAVGSGFYHCAFTSNDVCEPSASRLYI